MFRVGQRVCCIKRGLWRSGFMFHNDGPKHGDVCTVSGIDDPEGKTYLVLLEFGFSGSYLARRFRPAVTTSTRKSRQATLDKYFGEYLKPAKQREVV